MSANSKSTAATPADVAAAAEEKKNASTVPAQVNPEGDSEATEGVCEDVAKKSFRDRVSDLTGKVKGNKKVVVSVLFATGVAAIAYAKYAAKKAAEVVESVEGVEWVDADEVELEAKVAETKKPKKSTV